HNNMGSHSSQLQQRFQFIWAAQNSRAVNVQQPSDSKQRQQEKFFIYVREQATNSNGGPRKLQQITFFTKCPVMSVQR
ncbi:hypothetical protein ACLOJK_029225, partial [Asimina triloba]